MISKKLLPIVICVLVVILLVAAGTLVLISLNQAPDNTPVGPTVDSQKDKEQDEDVFVSEPVDTKYANFFEIVLREIMPIDCMPDLGKSFVFDEERDYYQIEDVSGSGPATVSCEAALFRSGNGDPEYFLWTYRMDGVFDWQNLTVLEYTSGRFEEVTPNFLAGLDMEGMPTFESPEEPPFDAASDFGYDTLITLPQIGTRVVVTRESTGAELATLAWDGANWAFSIIQ